MAFEYANPSIVFPPLGSEDLIRLGEDLLHVYPIYYKDSKPEEETISSISDLISRGKTSPTGLSSADATVLAETFRKAIPGWYSASALSDPWTRLLIHALLRGSRIFPGLRLCDNPPDYTSHGYTDIWKGEYHGKPVCVKVVRTLDLTHPRKVERIYHRVIEESKLNSHPNVFRVIQVSKGLVPLCIMSPWTPDGNITRYTQMNPGTNRLVLLAQACRGLIHLHESGIFHGSISPNNILITQDGQACLGDFSIAGMSNGYYEWRYQPKTLRYQPETLRYMAPERRTDDGYAPASKKSDIYSFAMTSFSVLTGVLPYHRSDVEDIARRICRGERPSHPIDSGQSRLLQDPVWNVITTGWHHQPNQRCELSVMFHVLQPPSDSQPPSQSQPASQPTAATRENPPTDCLSLPAPTNL